MASVWGETDAGRSDDDTSTDDTSSTEPQTISSAADGLLARFQTGRGVAAAATVAFLVVQLIEVWSTRPTKNSGDIALIEMETRRVFSVGPPLLGAYSRFGWRHPGGTLFWVWSPIYELFGESARALSTAAACLAAFSLWWLSTRWSTNRGFSVALVAAALLTIGTLGEHGAAYAWNINAAMVPVIVVLGGCVASVVANQPTVPMLVTVAWWLFVFETHAGTGVLLLPVVLGALVALAVRRRRDRWQPANRRSFVVAAIAVAIVGSPLVVDAVLHKGGNLRSLIVWSSSNDSPTAGLATGIKVVGRATSLSFLRAPEQPHFLFDAIVDWGQLPGVLIVLGAGALVVAVRGRHRLATTALVMLAVAWVAAVAAIASIPTPVYFWLVTWLQPLAWVTWAVVAWSLWEAFSSSRRLALPSLAPGTAVIVVWVVAVGAGAAAAIGSGPPTEATDRSAGQVSTLAAAMRSEAGTGLIEIAVGADPVVSEVMAAGLLNELDRVGVTTCASSQWDYKVSGRWKCPPADGRVQPDRSTFVVQVEATRADPPPGNRLVAEADFLDAGDRQRVDEARATVLEFLEVNRRTDLNGVVGTEFTHLIASDPGLRIDDPAVAEAIDTLSWAAAFKAQRYVVYVAE